MYDYLFASFVYWFWCICNCGALKAFPLNVKMRLLWNDVISDAGRGGLVRWYHVSLYIFNAFNNTASLSNKVTVLLYRSEANAWRPRTRDRSGTAAKQETKYQRSMLMLLYLWQNLHAGNRDLNSFVSLPASRIPITPKTPFLSVGCQEAYHILWLRAVYTQSWFYFSFFGSSSGCKWTLHNVTCTCGNPHTCSLYVIQLLH